MGATDRMTDAEGLMWRLERDPFLSSNIAAVAFLDRRPDLELLRERLLGASLRMPRLRQRARPVLGDLAAPAWVVDADFDIDRHLRVVTVDADPDDRAVVDLASALATEPFDRTRSLWEFIVVEGLSRGRTALVQKLHHTIADGEHGVRLAMQYLDLERDAIPPPLPDRVPDQAGVGADGQPVDGDHPDPDLETAARVREAVGGALRLPMGVADRVRRLLDDPTSIPDASRSAVATVQGLADQLGNVEPARSPLWRDRSADRRLEIASAPLDATRTVATRLGGTLNAAFVTIAAEAASRHHVECGMPVESLRTSMAVSTRDDDSGANAFTLVRFLVPTATMPLDERFRAVCEAIGVARAAADDSADLDGLAALASALPMPVVARLARLQTSTVDFATSNVKGSPAEVYVAGAKVLATHPIGPVAGAAFNLTLLSYVDRLDMGLNIDPVAVEDPASLRRCVVESIDDFVALG